MKRSLIGVVLCICCLLAKDIYALTYQLYFYQNQREIAAKRCENRSRPQLKCNGKCQLAKQLKKLELDTEIALTKKQMPPLKVKTTEWIAISDGKIPFLNYFSVETIKTKLQIHYTNNYLSLQCTGIFHPPQV